MAEIIRFPASRRIPATAIPRERFEELAQLALEVVDQIVALLDATEAEPTPDAPIGWPSRREGQPTAIGTLSRVSTDPVD